MVEEDEREKEKERIPAPLFVSPRPREAHETVFVESMPKSIYLLFYFIVLFCLQ